MFKKLLFINKLNVYSNNIILIKKQKNKKNFKILVLNYKLSKNLKELNKLLEMKNNQSANLPFLNMQNKKNFTNFENSKNKVPLGKIEDQSSIKMINNYNIDYLYQDDLSPASKQITQNNTTNLSVIKKDASVVKPLKKIEEVNGEEEYKLCLKKALTEAISENDYVIFNINNFLVKGRTQKS